jgi:hypothetical protein
MDVHACLDQEEFLRVACLTTCLIRLGSFEAGMLEDMLAERATGAHVARVLSECVIA